MSADSGDDAPVEITLTQSKDQINKQIADEKLHHNRQNKNAKKRKPKWAKSQKKKKTKKKKLKEMSASQFKEVDFKDDNDSNEPPIKKRRLNKWMEESDLFHHVNNANQNENINNNNDDIDSKQIAIDDTQINKTQNEDKIDDKIDDNQDEQVPQEVIDLFEQAIKECKTEKQLEDEWKRIIDEQSKKYANLKHKLSNFDKVFIDGFQIEVNGVDRLNTSALKRALRMKHFSTKNHHRIKFNKKMCYGSTKPSFAFIQQSVNNKYDPNKPVTPSSFWGKKLKHLQKVAEQDELEKWLEM